MNHPAFSFVARFFALLAFFVMTPLGDTRAAEPALSENEKIEALLKGVASLDGATFVRNGKDYTAANAVKFLRAKWDSEKDKIRTAADFISKAASVSSTSGKPYQIRFKDGKTTTTGEYLSARLREMEKKQ